MLSRCFHFGVSEIFVSSLFLPSILSNKPYCISVTYKELTGFQEKDNDDLLKSILQYNIDMREKGVVAATTPLRRITNKFISLSFSWNPVPCCLNHFRCYYCRMLLTLTSWCKVTNIRENPPKTLVKKTCHSSFLDKESFPFETVPNIFALLCPW